MNEKIKGEKGKKYDPQRYDKLVRDKIPEKIRKSGDKPFTHIADDKEYKESLIKKLKEEVDEFLKDPDKEEIADILEVLYAICDLQGVSKETVESIRRKKAKKRGGFEKRIILERTE